MLTGPREAEYLERKFGSDVALRFRQRLSRPQLLYGIAFAVAGLYLGVVLAALIIQDIGKSSQVTPRTRLSTSLEVTRLLRVILAWLWAALLLVAIVLDRINRMPGRTSATRNLGKMVVIAAAVLALAVVETIQWAKSLTADELVDNPELYLAAAFGIGLLSVVLFMFRGINPTGRYAEAPPQYIEQVGRDIKAEQGRPIFTEEEIRQADSGADDEGVSAAAPEFASSESGLMQSGLAMLS